MNQTFDLQRFLLVLRLEIAEKGRIQLLMAAVLVGVMLVLMLPIIFSSKHVGMLSGLHGFALILLVTFGGSLYTNQVFNQYSSSDSATTTLMVPASRLERFLSGLLLNLLFIIPYILLFFSLHFWTIKQANNQLLSSEELYQPMNDSMVLLFLRMLLIVQGGALLGSIYFSKASYIKSVAVAFLLSVLGVAFNYLISRAMAPSFNDLSVVPFFNWVIQLKGSEKYHQLTPPETVQNLIYLLPVFILVALWYIAYVRLVEKEV